MSSSVISPADRHFMRHALRLAERQLGRTAPNPAVGAVVVKDGVILGAAATATGGRPHAETQALAQAGGLARGATLYVTLEPCSHHGQTGPCAEAVVKAGIARVVAAASDPDARVSGRGFAQLSEAGIEIVENLLGDEARALNEGFFSVITRGQPLVTLKLATSLDGKIADGFGTSQWITGDGSRRYVHYLRATHDAIVTGIGTVLADNPQLNCRLPGRESDSPARVILDGHLRTPPNAASLPALIVTGEGASRIHADRADALARAGARIAEVPSENGLLRLPEVLALLADQGITRLLVEAGGRLATSFMNHNLADLIYWFRAPFVIGAAGQSALYGENRHLRELSRLHLLETMRLSEDVVEIYHRLPL